MPHREDVAQQPAPNDVLTGYPLWDPDASWTGNSLLWDHGPFAVCHPLNFTAARRRTGATAYRPGSKKNIRTRRVPVLAVGAKVGIVRGAHPRAEHGAAVARKKTQVGRTS